VIEEHAMKRLARKIPVLAAASISLLALAGCSGVGQNLKRDKCADIPPGALPDPPGAHLSRFDAIQKSNAEAISYAIFVHEWYMGGNQLGPYGEYHLQQVARLLPSVPYPVMVQPTLDPALNELRRAVVVARLQRAGVTDAEARVRVEYPEAEGLFGEEATPIFRQMLRPSQQGAQNSGLAGTYLPTGAGGAAFSGGSGFGFGSGGFP
jgi:hypothetical protein